MKRFLRRRLLVVFPVILLLLARSILPLPAQPPVSPAHAEGGITIQVKRGQPQEVPPGGTSVLVVTIKPDACPGIMSSLASLMAGGTAVGPVGNITTNRGTVAPNTFTVEELIVASGGDPSVPLQFDVTFIAGQEGPEAEIKVKVLAQGNIVGSDSAKIAIKAGKTEEEKLEATLNCQFDEDDEVLACDAHVPTRPNEGIAKSEWFLDGKLISGAKGTSVTFSLPEPAPSHMLTFKVETTEGRTAEAGFPFGTGEKEVDDRDSPLGDKDGDGIPNNEDACPTVYAPHTWDGCPEEEQRDESVDDKSDEDKSKTTSDEKASGVDVLKQLILQHQGRLEEIPGWEQLSPQTQEQLRQLAVSLGVLAQASQTSSQPDDGAQLDGQPAEGQWSGGGGSQIGQDKDKPPDKKQPKQEPAIQLTKAQQDLHEKLENQEDILRVFNKAWYSAKFGESLYKIGHGLSTIGKDAYDSYNEYEGVVSDPEQVLIQKFQDYQKQKAVEAGKQVLQKEGVLYGEGTSYVSEQEFAQAVFEWAQATTQAVVPIHYTYYRQVYDQQLPFGRDPTGPEKQQAHQNAVAALRDRLAGRNQQTLTEDLTQPQAGGLGPTGNMGYAWVPKYQEVDDEGRDIMGYMTAYEQAFPELNEFIDVD